MVRTSRGNPRPRVAFVLGTLALLVLVAGCAGSRKVSDPCEPCGPCGPSIAMDPCAGAPPADLPPNVGPGEAWCRVWVPPVYGTEMETYCVKPATQRQVQIPARWGTRPMLVCVDEAKMRERVVPAVYGVKHREVMVSPAQECWKRIECAPGDLGPGERQCECWTKTEIPPKYCDEPCPVCLEPERRCVQYTPARYGVEEERFILEPARCETICVPAEFDQRCRQVCVKPGHWEWRRNESCEVPCAPVPCTPCPVPCQPKPCAPPAPAPAPEALPALQVEMVDNAESGAKAGQFSLGDVVRYDLQIVSDGGSQALSGLKVLFTLPPELEFLSGQGQGIVITGGAQSGQTSSFELPLGTTQVMQVLCRVIAVPPTNLVQMTASVQSAEGLELATETESTTLKN